MSKAGRSYAVLGTTGYELPASIRSRLVRKAAKGRNGLTKTLEQFGIAPWRWEKDLAIAGKETIAGVETTHITTGFYVGRQLMDANTLLGLLSSLGVTRAVGLPSRVTRQARRAVVDGADPKRMGASWIATKDNVYRQSGFTLHFDIAKNQRARLGGLSSGTVVGLLKVTEVGEPQEIAAPAQLGPFADFELALDALGDAQRVGLSHAWPIAARMRARVCWGLLVICAQVMRRTRRPAASSLACLSASFARTSLCSCQVTLSASIATRCARQR